MKVFVEAMRKSAADGPDNCRWIYVPEDQLSDGLGPLAREAPETLGIVLIESRWKAQRRPYHKQKLALVLANMRHFALEQVARGVRVKYVVTDKPYGETLGECLPETGQLRVMEPAERELRDDLSALVRRGEIEVLPHEGWLSSPEDFRRSQGRSASDGPWRMDRFYRHMRKKTGLLIMADGQPQGGKLSFDADNRQPWRGDPPAPDPPRFEADPITREVVALVHKQFAGHPGQLHAEHLPATATDVETLWSWAKARCLPHFGPYEDAMSRRSLGLFHTRISPLLNLHRILPRDVVQDVCGLPVPLPCKEGFVRQVLGWREFVRHVHRETDGFRRLPGAPATPCRGVPGDAGYERWCGRPWRAPAGPVDGGAMPNFLGADRPLPPAFWGELSGLACLDRVVEDVWRSGYGHHITRLMILCNFGALLDIDPRELTDWFWVAYADAYDWVVEPNVIGMGLFAASDLLTTKPYVCGTPYIDRMSDYCGACTFDPKKSYPVSPLYWAYLARHAERFERLPRMRVPLASLRRRSAPRRRADQLVFERVRATLDAGRGLPTTIAADIAGDDPME